MPLRVIRGIKMSSDWFGCVFVIPLYLTEVLSGWVANSSSCFADIYLFALNVRVLIGYL